MKVNLILKTLKEVGPSTIDQLHKHILKRYGKTIPSLSVILDTLVELGFIYTTNYDGKEVYVLREEPHLIKSPTPTPQQVQKSEEPKVEEKPIQEAQPKKYRIVPLNRNYDWSEFIPKVPVEYIPQGDEMKKLEACQRLRIEGPPGCGKTLLVEWYCYKNKLPLFSVQGYGARVSDLIGTPWIVENTAFWVDGILTKALLCSQERPCVLLVDEFNRMDPYEQAAFLEIADYRCQLTIPLTSEIIKGNPDNLKIVLTMNVGTEYFVHKLDDAIKRRFPRIELDFLGLVKPEAEVQAVVKQTGIGKNLAKLMVEVANKIRKSAKSEKSTIRKGIPTHNIIEWARLAIAYKRLGIRNPLLEAGLDAVASYYEGIARKEVEQILRSYVDLIEKDESKYWKN